MRDESNYFIVTASVTKNIVACTIVTPSGESDDRRILAKAASDWQDPDQVRNQVEHLIIRMYPGVKSRLHGAVEQYAYHTDKSSVYTFRVDVDSVPEGRRSLPEYLTVVLDSTESWLTTAEVHAKRCYLMEMSTQRAHEDVTYTALYKMYAHGLIRRGATDGGTTIWKALP